MDDKAKRDRKVTAVMLITFATVLLVWDIHVATNDAKGDTISELLRDLSFNWWVLPFTLMGVMGHLFWNKRSEKERVFRPDILAGTTILVALRDLTWIAADLPVIHYGNLVAGIAGFVVGARFWPQGPKMPSPE